MKNNFTLYAVLSCSILALGACQEDSLVQEGSKGNVTIIGRMNGDVNTHLRGQFFT